MMKLEQDWKDTSTPLGKIRLVKIRLLVTTGKLSSEILILSVHEEGIIRGDAPLIRGEATYFNYAQTEWKC